MTNPSKSLIDNINATSCILLDIEGTITSIDFVRKNLFTYGEQHISSYIEEHWNDVSVQEVMAELLQNNTEGKNPENILSYEIHKGNLTTKLLHLMEKNEKTPAIKNLEGLVWKQGFLQGDLRGHVYPDVVDALNLWKEQGKKIFIYSNGSVEAQCLLLTFSMHGDLKKFIDGNFDSNIGSKIEALSYSKICQEIEKLPVDIVFFSDHPQELLAAKQSGLNIVLVVRDLDHPMFLKERSCLSPKDPVINSFSELLKDNKEEK